MEYVWSSLLMTYRHFCWSMDTIEQGYILWDKTNVRTLCNFNYLRGLTVLLLLVILRMLHSVSCAKWPDHDDVSDFSKTKAGKGDIALYPPGPPLWAALTSGTAGQGQEEVAMEEHLLLLRLCSESVKGYMSIFYACLCICGLRICAFSTTLLYSLWPGWAASCVW